MGSNTSGTPEVIELDSGQTAQIQDKSINNSEPEGISPESWQGWWVNWKSISILHTVLDDMFNAKGGCKGEIMDGTDPDLNGFQYDGYSYIIPYSTELQWRTRVLQSPYTNFFKRFIMAQIRSVFAQDSISYKVYKGSSEKSEKTDDFLDFMNNSTGTGVNYRDLQVFAAQERKTHDVAYYIMTKPVDSDIPALTVRTAVDFIMATGDENGKLETIMFYNGKKYVENKMVASAELWYMDGTCHVQEMEGDWDGNRETLGDVEYKPVGPPIDTEVGPEKKKKERTVGGNSKLKLFSTPFANITDPKTKKTEKVKILRFEENPASKELSRRHILTKGTIIQTEKGLAKITSRPGQHGVINAVLIGEE